MQINRVLSVLVIPVLLLSSGGCARTPSPARPVEKIPGVPFYPDDQYWCGPASLAGVMNYWGAGTRPKTIADKIYSPGARGTLPSDLRWYAREKGFEARITEGTPGGLRERVKEGTPVIVFVEYRTLWGSYPHFMVLVGYTPAGPIVNSGTERAKRLNRDAFLEAWNRTGRLQIIVKPGTDEGLRSAYRW